ncbi:hypothetical protein OS493_024913 [Desmophyllum pertusum]|uniref:Uncharacterized protein n=1 Tax=Desmophyllum pertusum TaxID=174260 RepID=A0A9W9YPF9_9CNID|nr:hypothetical protein OS493_024913 [Desmophyllum pertusum]
MAEHAQSTEEAASNFPRDHQESSHQRSGADFVDNVQLRCKSIVERVRLINQSVDVIGKEHVFNGCGVSSQSYNLRLLRNLPTKFNTDTKQAPCQETLACVEEKTLESNDKTAEHPAKPVSLNDSVEETGRAIFHRW